MRPEKPITAEGPDAEFAKYMRIRRRASGLTLKNVAEKAGYSTSALSKISDGRTITWRQAESYLRACDADIEEAKEFFGAVRCGEIPPAMLAYTAAQPALPDSSAANDDVTIVDKQGVAIASGTCQGTTSTPLCPCDLISSTHWLLPQLLCEEGSSGVEAHRQFVLQVPVSERARYARDDASWLTKLVPRFTLHAGSDAATGLAAYVTTVLDRDTVISANQNRALGQYPSSANPEDNAPDTATTADTVASKLGTVTTFAEVADLLDQARQKAGLSWRKLADLTASGEPSDAPALSTIHEMVVKRKAPTRDITRKIATACGASPEEISAWETGWDRIAANERRKRERTVSTLSPIRISRRIPWWLLVIQYRREVRRTLNGLIGVVVIWLLCINHVLGKESPNPFTLLPLFTLPTAVEYLARGMQLYVTWRSPSPHRRRAPRKKKGHVRQAASTPRPHEI